MTGRCAHAGLALAFAVVAAAAPVEAQARTPLRAVPSINEGLVAVRVADQIRRNCPTISARMLRALNYLHKLKSEAETMGYSRAEIDAFTSDEAERARVRALGEAYLEKHGARRGVPESYCALGRAEIAKSSRIGALLRTK